MLNNSEADTSCHCKERVDWKGMMYLLPLFTALFATVVSPHMQIATMQVGVILEAEQYRTYMYGALYLLSLVLVLTKGITALKMMRFHWPYLLFLAFIIITAEWSYYPGKVFITWGHFVGFYLITLSAMIGLQGKDPLYFFRLIVLYAAITVLITFVAVLFFPDRGIMMIGEKQRWVGLTLNANTLGMTLLFSVWGTIVFFQYSRSVVSKVFLFLLLGALAVALYGSDSMTSIVLSVMLFLSLPVLLKISRMKPLHAQISLAFLVVATLVCPLVIVAFVPDFFEPGNLLTKLTLIGRTATFTGRTSLWTVALQAIQEKPFLGWSFDALFSVSDRFLIKGAHLHNGYLEIMVYGGVFGLMLLIGTLTQMIFNLVKMVTRNGMLFVSLSMLLLVLLIHNITEPSFGRAPSFFWLVFTMLYSYLILMSNSNLRSRTSLTD